MTADVLEDAATGRFVLLHDPAGQEGWGGQWRCVTFARAAIDLEMLQWQQFLVCHGEVRAKG